MRHVMAKLEPTCRQLDLVESALTMVPQCLHFCYSYSTAYSSLTFVLKLELIPFFLAKDTGWTKHLQWLLYVTP